MAEALRVLIVAGSVEQTSLYVSELRRGGYDPASRRVDSESAMSEALAEQGRWDVVLADDSAPRFDGLKALTCLKKRARDIPVVLVAGATGLSSSPEAREAGADRCVDKDDLAALVPAVKGAIRDSAARSSCPPGPDNEQSPRFLLRALMDGMTDRIYFKDLDSRFVRINQALADMFGLSDPAEAAGKTDFDFFTDEHARQAFEDEQQVIETGRPVVAKDEKETWPDGHETWVSTTKLPLRDEQGRIVGTFGISRDITEHHLAEQEQKRLEAQLLQAQKMEATGRLAGGVAHDYRNQLTVIRGYCDILLKQFGQDDPSRGPIEEIRAAAERSATLTTQLLAFSRKQILSPAVFDIEEIVSEMQEPIRRMLGEDITILVVPTDADTHVLVDRAQVEQALINLAVNARDAMPGGGRLTIETAAVNFDREYVRRHVGTRTGPHVMFAVSDTGTGMDANTQRQIFEPFFTTKEKGKGTGLGLSMVYGFVKQSGGTVYVYSELGRGTTFKIYLPRAEAPARAADGGDGKQVPAPRDYTGNETVLVVEDEDAVRQFLGNVLRRNGYTVLEAPDARAAVPLGEHYAEPIDLLVTDVVMPGMSGPDLARHLASVRPEMPVLFLSGYTADAVAQHGVLDSGVDLLSKPFGPVALLQAVRKILDAREGDTPAKDPDAET